MKYSYVATLGFILITLLACSEGTVANENKSLENQMSLLDQQAKRLIGSANCSLDTQCHSIGFGHKPCGGFYAYRIYSDKKTDVAQLVNTVNQYNALSRELNKKNNLVSNCMMLMQPVLTCYKQACQIK